MGVKNAISCSTHNVYTQFFGPQSKVLMSRHLENRRVLDQRKRDNTLVYNRAPTKKFV